MRDARLHLRHVRDLLRSLDPADAYNGVNCSSLSYLSYYTRGAKGKVLSLQGCCFFLQQSSTPFASVLFPSDGDSLGSKQASEKESVDLKPPEYLLPGCKDLPLTPLQPIRDDRKVREHFVLTNVSENKALNKTVTLGRFRNGGGDTVPAHQYGRAKKPQKKSTS